MWADGGGDCEGTVGAAGLGDRKTAFPPRDPGAGRSAGGIAGLSSAGGASSEILGRLLREKQLESTGPVCLSVRTAKGDWVSDTQVSTPNTPATRRSLA